MQQVGERRQADRLGGDRVALRALVLSAVREPGAPVEGAAPDPQKGGPADGDAPRLVEVEAHPQQRQRAARHRRRRHQHRARRSARLALAGGAVVDGGAGERAARVLVVVAGREDEVDAEQARGLVAHAARVLRGVLEGVEVLRREEVVQQPVAAPPLRRLLARHGLVGLRDDPEGALVHLDAVLPLLVDGAERVQVLAHLLKVLRPRRARLAEQRAVLALGRQRLRKLRGDALVEGELEEEVDERRLDGLVQRRQLLLLRRALLPRAALHDVVHGGRHLLHGLGVLRDAGVLDGAHGLRLLRRHLRVLHGGEPLLQRRELLRTVVAAALELLRPAQDPVELVIGTLHHILLRLALRKLRRVADDVVHLQRQLPSLAAQHRAGRHA
mmetsp:Transcript_1562/g.5420  ORF Transcript_1562/g.5420 Transcript_1562/m.5420 type:complete len:386 (+) Transcript_1562:240-1397(+)